MSHWWRNRKALTVVAVTLVCGAAIAVSLVLGIWLARNLTAASKMQDCLMSGRTNCNVIEPAQ